MTPRKLIYPIVFLSGIFILSSPIISLEIPKVHFSIVYTNDVMGEVEPCG